MSENALQAVPAVTPLTLIQQAIAGDASIEKMEQLLSLQLRWEENEARKAYNQAMSNFRAECPTIDRARKGHNTKYAGLAESIEAIRGLLTKHGLSHQWKTAQEGNQVTVTCNVTHILGHSESTSLTAAPDTSGSKNNIQAIGSTVSYLQRYTLFAILGLSSREMDDDGNQGKGAHVEKISEEQEMNILSLIAEVNADESKFCVAYQIQQVADLPAVKYEKAVKQLESKRK